jgi:competence protein ComEA
MKHFSKSVAIEDAKYLTTIISACYACAIQAYWRGMQDMIPTPPSPPYRDHRQWRAGISSPLPPWQPGVTPVPPSTPIPVAATASASAYEISQQQTAPQPIATASTVDPLLATVDKLDPAAPSSEKRKRWQRVVAVGLLLALLIALFFTWNGATPAASPSGNTIQQNFSGSPTGNTSSTTDSGSSGNTITVYVVGAVKHPGVYTLPTDARVYQLLQAAGGPLPNANLVALNLAAKLSDGEEVYVVHIGETPPTYSGGVPQPGTGNSTGNTQLININTASADEMRQALHISSATAQAIVNYRTQHGPFTSVEQLQQVVSQSIYDKIKDQVTV